MSEAPETRELQPRSTLHEIAAFERVSVETVRRWVRLGKLRAIRQGRQLLVPKAELMEYERRRTY